MICLVRRDDFRFTAGEEEVVTWDTPGGGQRVFCGRCATRICNHPKKFPGFMSLVVASLDEEIGQAPVMHINVESKAPWYEIPDGVPRFDALPTDAQAALDEAAS